MSAFLAALLKIARHPMSIFTGTLSTRGNVLGPIGFPSNSESEKALHPMSDLLHELLSCYGLEEIVGEEHNPQIVAMFADIGFDWVKDDETAWCSAALNFFCKKLGYERSGSLAARSWLKMPVMILQPELGDIVVFWRGSKTSWQGHVGIYINQDLKRVWCLGGNQGNLLQVSPYPRDRVLGYRRLRKLTDIK